MTPPLARIAYLTLLLMALFAFLPVSYAIELDAHAMSPLELKVELNRLDNLDGQLLGPVRQESYELSDEEAPIGTHKHVKRYGSGGTYWFSQIKRQGSVAYGDNSSYVLWRNVMDYGATGDGLTDDTYAINNATADGNRCGYGCQSQTTAPAIVYFPPGTYIVSTPLIMYYYTQFIGDANDLPTIKGTADFFGIGLLDSDVYLPYGATWWVNQNNFYRQVRNFVLDLTSMPTIGAYHGIHWQVAQATSLQNIVFNMVDGSAGDNNTQYGIFMDNGSGGYMEDLIFNGGGVGFFAGNQQFTVRNLTFNGCETGIFQNWGWVFAYKEITFNDCNVGVDMTQGGEVPATGSLGFIDSVWNNVNYGILTTFGTNSTPVSSATLFLDNCDFVNTPIAIQYNGLPADAVMLDGNTLIESFVQGSAYRAYEFEKIIDNLTCWEPTANYSRIQQTLNPPPKSANLLTPSGTFYSKSRPQWEGVPVESFISTVDRGCPNDGYNDSTSCIQELLDYVDGTDMIAYFDHGAYVITDTVTIGANTKIQGEIWPLIMVTGDKFQDMYNPIPAIVVGLPGQNGTTEIVEMVFESRGPVPGAIMVEWNLAGTNPMDSGIYDSHWRMGGSNGTLLQSDNCTMDEGTEVTANNLNTDCIASFMLMHVTSTASLIISNTWGWVADHELDRADGNQVQIYNGRGFLCESQGPVWMYGTAFEHSMLYNYQIANAENIFMSIIQSETQYGQDNPNALSPFPLVTEYSDPTFSECYDAICYKTYGLRIFNSTYVFLYGAGLYSFFDNWDSACLLTQDCQQYMVSLEESEGIFLYALSTEAATNMVEVDLVAIVPQAANPATFCETVGIFEYP